MSIQVVDEIWYVPVLKKTFGNKKPVVFYKYMSPTRKAAVANLIKGSYGGHGDWAYRKKLGWTIEKVVIQDMDTFIGRRSR